MKMTLYLADTIQLAHLRYIDRLKGTGVLESYWRLITNKIKMDEWLEKIMETKLNLFLDSGAFSAWSKGVSIDLQEYIAFCKKYESALSVIAVLDVIPGVRNKTPSAEEKASAAQQSWNNYQIMLDAGLPKDKLLPCFHLGEDWSWLERYMGVTDYVALGAMAKTRESDRIAWLDRAMDILCGLDGIPKVRFHGFGMTSYSLMRRYPWYSVDSTSWVMTSRFGSILVPPKKDGQWIYSQDPWKVSVSEKQPDIEDAGVHYDSWPPVVQQIIKEYVKSKGFTMEGARTEYMVRDQLNIHYFKDFEKSLPAWPWPLVDRGRKGLF